MKLTNKKHYVRAAVIGLGVATSFLSVHQGTALATEENFDSTAAAIIKLLKEKNIITDAEAINILSRQRQAPVGQLSSPPPVTVVVPEGQQYLQTITDTVARDIKEEVKQEVKLALKDEISREVKLEAFTGSVPGWTKRIRFGGDIRLRYQGEFFDENNATIQDIQNFPELRNTREDRHLARHRIRLNATAKVNNQTEVGVTLATGNESSPVSTNDTLGDYMNKDTVTFDQAYVKWTPISETSTWNGNLDIWGGRMPNPFFSTDLVWDKDVNFEGLAATVKAPINARWKGLFNAGLFPLEEVELSSKDKWLYGAQIGVEYAPSTTFNFKLATGYYNYQNIEGQNNDASDTYVHTVPRSSQDGNAVFDINEALYGQNSGKEKFGLAADYDELNVTTSLDLGFWDPVHVVLQGDVVKNVGFDQAEILQRTGLLVPDDTMGYQVGLTVGYPKMQKLWDWQGYFAYRYLEADAVLDAFTDSDFHLGGTNAKGWILGGQLGVGENIWVNTRWMSGDEVSGPPIAIDAVQVDFNAKF